MSGFDLLPHFENPYPVKEQHTKSSPPAKSSATTPTTVPFDEDDDGSEDAPNREWIVPGGNHVTIEVFHWNPSCEAAECCGLGWMP
ncbi:hypothetical protein JCM1840_004761 [Sporobolomyces johnsonii]